ncbi:flagellar hook-basal body complex protein FliE [Salipiger abyssi]|uniref:flagellar hook-basal body complex protein FliE n=1 Tax=Salipiger abyssi TaxID=1250539 RepID=UPI001A9027D6|nr:flagellar hook-basal body complex protein FliE [Salipiger abyssi]MBN9886124.1 flagellar hook-basal body complex protein FliE [Salipiger abyssi]
MDVRSLFAAQKYAAQRPATEPQPGAGGIQEKFTEAAQDFAATLTEAETAAKAAMTGDADPHALVQALAQSELAVETVVAVRNKVVEAYQEILRMPV